MLERCLHASPDREIQREAFRLAYYYIFAFELPFPAVTVLGIYEAKSNYTRPEDLAPGKDDSLDHICNFLIEGQPLSDCPTVEEQSRTTADEDAFFEELAHSPDYLRNVRYERWLRLKSLGRLTTEFSFGVCHSELETDSLIWGDADGTLCCHGWNTVEVMAA